VPAHVLSAKLYGFDWLIESGTLYQFGLVRVPEHQFSEHQNLLCQPQHTRAMDDETAAIVAVVAAACSCASIVAVDKRSIRAPPSGTSTFRNRTFEQAMQASSTNWFHKKLRMDKGSFVRVYELVRDASPRLPAANSHMRLIKRVALTIIYLAQGCTMDAAASILGISRPRAVVYINDTLDVLSSLASTYVVMGQPSELPGIAQGFEKIAEFPDVVGAVDGTLVKIPRPHDFEGLYCRKNFPAVNAQAIVDHHGYFRSLSIRAGFTNDQSLWNGSGVKKR
jgi:hypothetical protein